MDVLSGPPLRLLALAAQGTTDDLGHGDALGLGLSVEPVLVFFFQANDGSRLGRGTPVAMISLHEE